MQKKLRSVRKFDKLGRVVLPKQIRDIFEIHEKDPLEIYVDANSIILKKYIASCIFCGSNKDLVEFKDKIICKKCRNNIGKRENPV